MATFSEGERVLYVEEDVPGTIEFVYEKFDELTDRPLGEPTYDVVWDDGECSSHVESELAALAEN